MTTATDDALIALRMRPDLVIRPQVYRRRRCWCIKDPVSLAYFHLSDDEYSVLRQLDGRTSLGRLRQALSERTPGAGISAESLKSFLVSLRRSGLVTAESPQSGEILWKQRKASRAQAVWKALPGVLAIRFRGVDPSRFLRWLDDSIGWLFTRGTFMAALALIATALLFALTRLNEFLAALPAADAFFTASNLAVLMGVIGGVKVLHELGHALACRRLGGECHELGLMLLVFAPCLYCDVTDSWMFPKKRHRIAVASAGIIVELVLASAATFGWWFSEPGLFHAVCMNLMLVCSMNTLWLNGNPLLRYDGYFVLSDLLEIPNLAAESRAAIVRLLFGSEHVTHPSLAGIEPTLIVYGIASAVYRIALTCFIVWMLLTLLTPIGLAPLGYALAAICAVGLVAGPVMAFYGALRSPRRIRAIVVLATGVVLLVIAALIPLPHRVEAPASLQPRAAHRVYAAVGGRLVEAPASGQRVSVGDPLFLLDDPKLEREVAELHGEHAELVTKLDALQSRRLDNALAATQLSAVRSAVEGVAAQLETRRRNFDELQIESPAAGTVLPPPDRLPIEVPGELPEWSGSPLDDRNRGCTIEAGTLLCLIGDPDRLEATLYVVEDQVQAIRPGQPVRVLPDQAAGRSVAGIVEAISANPLRVVPAELAREQILPARPDADGSLRPIETTYEVRVRFDEDVATQNFRGGASEVRKSPPARRRSPRVCGAFLRRTFRFDL